MYWSFKNLKYTFAVADDAIEKNLNNMLTSYHTTRHTTDSHLLFTPYREMQKQEKQEHLSGLSQPLSLSPSLALPQCIRVSRTQWVLAV